MFLTFVAKKKNLSPRRNTRGGPAERVCAAGNKPRPAPEGPEASERKFAMNARKSSTVSFALLTALLAYGAMGCTERTGSEEDLGETEAALTKEPSMEVAAPLQKKNEAKSVLPIRHAPIRPSFEGEEADLVYGKPSQPFGAERSETLAPPFASKYEAPSFEGHEAAAPRMGNPLEGPSAKLTFGEGSPFEGFEAALVPGLSPAGTTSAAESTTVAPGVRAEPTKAGASAASPFTSGSVPFERGVGGASPKKAEPFAHDGFEAELSSGVDRQAPQRVGYEAPPYSCFDDQTPPALLGQAPQVHSGRCSQSQIADFSAACSGQVGSAACQAFVAANPSCGACVLGSDDGTLGVLYPTRHGQFSVNTASCSALVLGEKECAKPLALQEACLDAACPRCAGEPEKAECRSRAASSMCANVMTEKCSSFADRSRAKWEAKCTGSTPSETFERVATLFCGK